MKDICLSDKITRPEKMSYCGKAHLHIEDVKEAFKKIDEDFEIELSKLIKEDGNVGVSDIRTSIQTIFSKRLGDELIK
jgi:hypothetical protein